MQKPIGKITDNLLLSDNKRLLAIPDSLVIQVFANYEKAYSYFNKVKASADSSFLDAFEVQNIKVTIAIS